MFVTGVNNATATRLARYWAEASQAADASTARIASGRRFTTFAEDPVAATKEISLRAQQSSSAIYLRATQAAAAAADAASDGLRSASEILLEMRNAVVGLDTSNDDSKHAVQQTVAQLNDALTRIAQTTTTIGGTKLLDGSIDSTALSFTVDATGSAPANLTAISVDASELGIDGGLQLGTINFTAVTPTTQTDALAAIDAAQSAVIASMASTGAMSSAMTHHATVLGQQASARDIALDNLVSVDAAQEMATLTRNRLIAESAAAMLAQAGSLQASMVRQLLTGR
ncbi:MAG: flagellin [Actinoplanes sp.]